MEFAPSNPPTIDKIARSAVFAVIARGMMILASAVGLPVAGFMLNRVITVIDRIDTKSEQTARQVLLIHQRVNTIKDEVKDHESRIRAVEAKR